MNLILGNLHICRLLYPNSDQPNRDPCANEEEKESRLPHMMTQNKRNRQTYQK
jgi:hypothetical protein